MEFYLKSTIKKYRFQQIKNFPVISQANQF